MNATVDLHSSDVPSTEWRNYKYLKICCILQDHYDDERDKTIFHNTTPDLQDQDQDRFSWSQTGLVLRPTISDHITAEYSVFRMPDSLKSTSMGLDGLPDWFIRLAAPAFAQPQSLVPHQWKSSCITPLPKVKSPVACQDYRPITVTAILSRLMEKSLVKQLLYPVLIHPHCSHLFSDQFGFIPTAGSTTAALVYLLHQIFQLLLNLFFFSENPNFLVHIMLFKSNIILREWCCVYIDFYRATLCISAVYAVVWCLSVRLSVLVNGIQTAEDIVKTSFSIR